jgi:hypothetical protein
MCAKDVLYRLGICVKMAEFEYISLDAFSDIEDSGIISATQLMELHVGSSLHSVAPCTWI